MVGQCKYKQYEYAPTLRARPLNSDSVRIVLTIYSGADEMI